MSAMFTQLAAYFQYPFVRYAFIVGVLVALCSSLLGVTLVLKRFSLIGDGLSHVAFGAMAVAAVLKMNSTTALTLPVTVVCAVLLLQGGRNRRIKGDAAGIVVSVLAGTPVGSTIVAGNIISFLFCAALGRLRGVSR